MSQRVSLRDRESQRKLERARESERASARESEVGEGGPVEKVWVDVGISRNQELLAPGPSYQQLWWGWWMRQAAFQPQL